MHFLSCKTMFAAAATALTTIVLLASPALAHPHVFIQVRTLLIVESGQLTGLHHVWLLDEGWLASQLEAHDKDKDGKLDDAELSAVAAESRGTLDTFKSFTNIRHAGQRIRPGAPAAVKIQYFGDQLGMSFTAPLPKPIPLAGADLLLEVYDATYFSGHVFAGPDAVDFAGDQPAGCRIKSAAPPSPQQLAAYRMLARQYGADFTKLVSPDAVAITCDPADAFAPVATR